MSYFITGTDTDAGKTVATAALLCALRAAGRDAVPMKPFQTGSDDGRSIDIDFCLRLAGLPDPAPDEYDLMSPVRLAMPASPHLAAARAGVELSLAPAIAAFKKLQFRHETVLVEGAGGVLVPVCGNQTMLDLMVALALPVILVARPGLGTINHSLLSINELRRAKLRLAGVLFCATTAKPWGEIEEDNMQTVARLGKVPVLGHIPWIPGLGETVPPPPAFLQHFRLPTCP